MVSNHRSLLDAPALILALQLALTAVHKRSLLWVPFLGQALMLGRGVPINRKDSREARKDIAVVAHRLRTGRSVLIFPEGTRSRGMSLQPFKKGAVVMAIEQQGELLPVTITGTDALYPPGQWMIHRGDILVTIHPPVSAAGTSLDQRDELTARCRQAVERTFRPGPVGPEELKDAIRVA